MFSSRSFIASGLQGNLNHHMKEGLFLPPGKAAVALSPQSLHHARPVYALANLPVREPVIILCSMARSKPGDLGRPYG